MILPLNPPLLTEPSPSERVRVKTALLAVVATRSSTATRLHNLEAWGRLAWHHRGAQDQAAIERRGEGAVGGALSQLFG